jgi:hypothetical protein
MARNRSCAVALGALLAERTINATFFYQSAADTLLCCTCVRAEAH